MCCGQIRSIRVDDHTSQARKDLAEVVYVIILEKHNFFEGIDILIIPPRHVRALQRL
jgi:hypothetical protein